MIITKIFITLNLMFFMIIVLRFFLFLDMFSFAIVYICMCYKLCKMFNAIEICQHFSWTFISYCYYLLSRICQRLFIRVKPYMCQIFTTCGAEFAKYCHFMWKHMSQILLLLVEPYVSHIVTTCGTLCVTDCYYLRLRNRMCHRL
jgi:hypothetical protein